jgi:hypothetical protein
MRLTKLGGVHVPARIAAEIDPIKVNQYFTTIKSLP